MDRIDPTDAAARDDPPRVDPAEVDPDDEPTGAPAEGHSSVGDYVRDLQLEYEEQQEEGKI